MNGAHFVRWLDTDHFKTQEHDSRHHKAVRTDRVHKSPTYLNVEQLLQTYNVISCMSLLQCHYALVYIIHTFMLLNKLQISAMIH